MVTYGNPNATPGFWREIAWPPGLLERKYNNKVEAFFTLTWITGKELEREIKIKGDEFCWKSNTRIYVGGQKMRNASGQQAAASKLKISGSEKIANRNTSNKTFFFHKMCN